MVTAEKSILIDAPAQKILDTITDFESYPDFLSEMKSVKVVKRTAKQATVAFAMDMIQKVNYTLKFALGAKDGVAWTFVEGDSILKDNSGFWRIAKKGKVQELTYSVNVEFNMWLPGSVIKSLLDEHLPKMLEKFKRRIESA